jgi:ketosteroid isomerase-like protein
MRARTPRWIAGIALAGVLIASACNRPPEAGPGTSTSTDVEAIKRVLDNYVLSVNAADTQLAREVWAEREGITFIHPLGHERGWSQIKTNFYDTLMAGMFSARTLTLKNLTIEPYGESAVVEFDWEFNATLKNGGPIKTDGRETDVLIKDPRGAWRLAHAHYSGMPPSGGVPPGDPSRGF